MGNSHLKRLSALAVGGAKAPGHYSDGDGLFLAIGKTGGKSWIVQVQKMGVAATSAWAAPAKCP